MGMEEKEEPPEGRLSCSLPEENEERPGREEASFIMFTGTTVRPV